MFWKFKEDVFVADDERIVLLKEKRLSAVCGPGKHRLVLVKNESDYETFRVSKEGISHSRLDAWLKIDIFNAAVTVIEAKSNQVGLLTIDGKLEKILAPDTRYVQWKSSYSLDVEWIDLTQGRRLPESLLSLLLLKGLVSEGKRSHVVMKTVPEGQAGLLFENGQLVDVLGKGVYGYWAYGNDVSIQLCDMKQRLLEISGQEMLTSDRLSLRMNVVAMYRLVDVRVAVSQLANVGDYVYKIVQLALREAVGMRSLDDLLRDKEALSGGVFTCVEKQISAHGLVLESIGVKDIILPGEMKDLLNQVVQAQKSAEANIIKRREETAATRSLSNTARMLADNPTLMRLKELETLEKVVGRINTLNVSGGLDSLMNDLVTLNNVKAVSKGG